MINILLVALYLVENYNPVYLAALNNNNIERLFGTLKSFSVTDNYQYMYDSAKKSLFREYL